MLKRCIALSGVLVGLAWLAGCERRSEPAAGPSPQAKSAEASTAGGGINPIENYKQQRLNDAMRGLLYDDGVVRLDPVEGPKVAGELEGQTFEGLMAEGRMQMESSLHVEAIGSFTRAVILDMTRSDGLEALGDALITKGKLAESQAAYASALQIDDQSVSVHFKFAENLQRQGDLDGQIGALNVVLELDPDHAEAHVRLAIAHYYRQEYDTARQHVQAARTLGGSVPPQFLALLDKQPS